MGTILRTGVVRGGQIVLPEPMELPDGSEVTILGRNADDPPRSFGDVTFMTEDEQGDGPDAIRQWVADLRAIPPVPGSPEKDADRRAWEEQMRRFNIAAVREQFDGGTP